MKRGTGNHTLCSKEVDSGALRGCWKERVVWHQVCPGCLKLRNRLLTT